MWLLSKLNVCVFKPCSVQQNVIVDRVSCEIIHVEDDQPIVPFEEICIDLHLHQSVPREDKNKLHN